MSEDGAKHFLSIGVRSFRLPRKKLRLSRNWEVRESTVFDQLTNTIRKSIIFKNNEHVVVPACVTWSAFCHSHWPCSSTRGETLLSLTFDISDTNSDASCACMNTYK